MTVCSTAQETVTVQTLTYDSTGRDYMFDFPEEDGTTYERILMLYNMRCKGAKVSVPGNTNLGCGEWDYSCNTYVVDSSYTDSLASTHPTHIVSGFSGDVFDFTNTPTNVFTQYDQKEVTYTNTASESLASVGTGNEKLNHPFSTQSETSKTQYIWTASELTSAGLSAGNISGLQLELDDALSGLDFLRIRMGHTGQSRPNSTTILIDELQQVYFLNSTLTNGNNYLRFYDDFDWDGLSNVIVEFSFSNSGVANESNVLGSDASNGIGLTSSGANSHLTLIGNENINLPSNGFDQVSNEITISLWSYGDSEALPRNTSIFEGTDNQNRRQTNVHLPWSNGRIYWDCGFEGTFDRIDKQADPEDFSGKWNHWAFTKNASTGDMKIFLNGNLWHFGTGKTRPIDLKKMILGSNKNIGNKYFGKIDEFRVWNKALDQATIAEWMTKRLAFSHPNFSNLITYLDFGEGEGGTLINLATPGGIAQINGDQIWSSPKGSERIRDFISVDTRPNISFVSGEYTKDITTNSIIDTVENIAKTITEYKVVGTDIEIENTNSAWEAKPEPLYAEDGSLLDSYDVNIDGTIEIGSLDYFNKFPSRFEIMSFVTPYGIYLDLGEEGKTWTFDVTDFAPILKGKKRMYLTLGGQNQEEMDIKFVYIKGTPPRDVMDIRQIWRSGRSVNNGQILADASFAPVNYRLDENGAAFKIRTAITGHGQEGEFIPRFHQVEVNGQTLLNWQVWKECADNPVYPQGGTWIYDRAGWCPGAPTDVQHIDITSIVNPGEVVNIDYDMLQASGDSRYIVNHQLVTYGAPNFETDARLADVMRPSNKAEYQRVNPVCNAPIVVIENTGSETLTSATITYYVHGGNALTYEWTGSLEFLEKEEVALPLPDMSFWQGSGQTKFIAEVSNPNGSQDEYTDNDEFVSTFDMPDVVNEEALIIYTFTNSLGFQNSFRVIDFNLDTILRREDLISTNFYEDTLQLADGCYTLEIDDTGDNGMEFWAQPSQGAGSLTLLTVDLQLIKNIDPDFGRKASYSFVKGPFTNIKTVANQLDFQIFPNPNNGIFTLAVSLDKPEDINILVTDVTGKTVFTKRMDRFINGRISMDLSGLSEGLYYCTIMSGSNVSSQKMVIGH